MNKRSRLGPKGPAGAMVANHGHARAVYAVSTHESRQINAARPPVALDISRHGRARNIHYRKEGHDGCQVKRESLATGVAQAARDLQADAAEGVRVWSLKTLTLLMEPTPDRRWRVLEPALKVNRLRVAKTISGRRGEIKFHADQSPRSGPRGTITQRTSPQTTRLSNPAEVLASTLRRN